MKRILFVDDEPNVLAGLSRMLYPLRREWEMVFVTSGREALARLDETPFDILITDVRMPEMNGVELLSAVLERHPQVVRLVLSGTADREFTLQSVALAHQFLSKPCDAKVLRDTVNRACALRELLEDPGLKALISRTSSLPSVPSVYSRLTAALQSPDISPKHVAEIIADDMAMSAKILQLVNSAFFGIQRRITNLADAVVVLGIETVRDLALAFSIFSEFKGNGLAHGLIEHLRDHCLAVARLAYQIARSSRLDQPAAGDAFTAGLLHDVGKLVLIANRTEQYDQALRMAADRGLPAHAAELEVFGTTHSEVGTYLSWLWGLPEAVTQVTSLHHNPAASPPETARLVVAVHVADALVNQRAATDIDLDYLARMGWREEFDHWKSLPVLGRG